MVEYKPGGEEIIKSNPKSLPLRLPIFFSIQVGIAKLLPESRRKGAKFDEGQSFDKFRASLPQIL